MIEGCFFPGIRGELNIIVKVDLFSDVNKFRQSSCGIQFFSSEYYFMQWVFHISINMMVFQSIGRLLKKKKILVDTNLTSHNRVLEHLILMKVPFSNICLLMSLLDNFIGSMYIFEADWCEYQSEVHSKNYEGFY